MLTTTSNAASLVPVIRAAEPVEALWCEIGDDKLTLGSRVEAQRGARNWPTALGQSWPQVTHLPSSGANSLRLKEVEASTGPSSIPVTL